MQTSPGIMIVQRDEPADRDVACPLCDYNLRGLVEPRCPECGYAFSWDELLDPNRQTHPYLFEHHPRRNVRSFIRTLAGGLLPRRFWRTLQPIHAIRPRRLILYYLIATALFVLAPFVLVARPYALAVREQLDNREFQRGYFLNNRGDPVTKEILQKYGSVNAYIDTLPSPYWGIWTRYSMMTRTRLDAASVGIILVVLVWPWLTFATLMIFRASMRRAKVTAGHVLRCTLYSCDWPLWLGGLAVAIFTVPFAERWLPIFYPIASGPILAAALFATYTTYRLGSAYALYLRFDRPYATALVAQLIVLLAVMAFVTSATF